MDFIEDGDGDVDVYSNGNDRRLRSKPNPSPLQVPCFTMILAQSVEGIGAQCD